MSRESRSSSSREFQLETRHLAAILLLVAILCIASFMLGRWVERQAYRATAAASLVGDGASEQLDVEDVNRELTYFRTLDGKEPPPSVDRPSEPDLETPVTARRRSGARSSDEDVVAGAGGNDGLMVQVMATKDLAAAIAMRQRLMERGYQVSLLEGSGSRDAGLHKVRVGPYPDRRSAARAAAKLEAEEGVSTWIP